MNIWMLIFFASVLTLAERLSFIMLIGDREIPVGIKKALQYVPVTVLTALALPAITLNEGTINISFNPKMLAAIVAVLVAWRSKNLFLTIIAGMVTFWVLSVFIPV